jgi:hypothetical protein
MAPLRHDAAINAEWDELTRLAVEAWFWRDPDAIAALEVCVARLKTHVRDDWNCQEL